MSADYGLALLSLAVQSGSGNWFPSHDPARRWIIIHGTAGFTTAQDVAAYFRSSAHSTHYVVGRDGTVIQCVSETDSAWGNASARPIAEQLAAGADPWWGQFKNPNTVTFSIEHVKPSIDNTDVLTPAQAQASFALVKHLCERWNIPRHKADARGGITAHASIDPIDRARCPGPYPWNELFAYLGGPSSVSNDQIVLPHAQAISEFGFGYNGDCVETAMAAAIACAKGTGVNAQQVLDIVHTLQSEGIASANGATTINACARYMHEHGYDVIAEVGYAEPFNGDWLSLLRVHAGVHPIVLNIANAGVLVDAETGSPDEHNVKYHAIAVLGKQANGYICADGDNPQANQRLQIYTRQMLEAAQPCGIVIIGMQTAAPQPARPTGGTSMSTLDTLKANGWQDDGTTLTAKNGNVLIHGFRDWFLAQDTGVLDRFGLPLGAEYGTDNVAGDGTHGAGSEQLFERGALGWTARENVFVLWVGSMLAMTRNAVQQSTAQVASLSQQLDAAGKEIQTLQAQVVQLQQTPVPPQPPTMPTPAQPIPADPKLEALGAALVDYIKQEATK